MNHGNFGFNQLNHEKQGSNHRKGFVLVSHQWWCWQNCGVHQPVEVCELEMEVSKVMLPPNHPVRDYDRKWLCNPLWLGIPHDLGTPQNANQPWNWGFPSLLLMAGTVSCQEANLHVSKLFQTEQKPFMGWFPIHPHTRHSNITPPYIAVANHRADDAGG